MFSGFRCCSLVIVVLMMFGCLELFDLLLVSIVSRLLMDIFDMWLFRLLKFEIIVGVEFSVFMLNMFEMLMLEFSILDVRLLVLFRLESVFIIGFEVWFSKLDIFVLKLVMFELLLLLVLKKFDDGSLVELLKFGSVGMLMIEMLMGLVLLRMLKFSGIGLILVLVMVIVGMLMDILIGMIFDIEILLIVEVGMLIGGMLMGMDWLNEIVGNLMVLMVCCSGRVNLFSVVEVRGMVICI